MSKTRLDKKCWDGYKIGKPATKMKGDTRVNNCIPESKPINEMTMCEACAKAMLEDIRDGVIKSELTEAEYRGRKVTLNKPMRGDVKKFKVYVRDPKTGNIKKVNFGHGGTSAKKAGQKTMRIRKSNPKARKSFRARHNCDNPGPKTKARYWSCKKW
jgi:hypothetical protein